MSILSGVLEIFASAGFGSVLGVVAGYFTRREENKMLVAKNEHERHIYELKNNHEMSVLKQKADHQVIENQGQVEKYETMAFVEGQKVSTSFAENLKAVVRPLILIALLVQTYLICEFLYRASGIDVAVIYTPTQLIDLTKTVIYAVLSLLSMAVSWYFTQRTSKGFDQALRQSILNK